MSVLTTDLLSGRTLLLDFDKPDLEFFPMGRSSGSNGGLTEATADTLYLRLDTTNDPLTAGLKIDGSADEEQLIIEANATQTALPFLYQDSAGNRKFAIGSEGYIAVGDTAASPTATVIAGFRDTFTATSGTVTGASIFVDAAPSGATSAVYRASQQTLLLNATPSVDYTGIVRGGDFSITSSNGSPGIVEDARAGDFAFINNGTGTVTDAQAGCFKVSNTSTGTITNAYGLLVKNNASSGGGAITNNYGIYVQAQTVGTTINRALVTDSGAVVFNEAGHVDADFRIESDTMTSLFHVDAGLNGVSINNQNPPTAVRSIFSVRELTGGVATLERVDASVLANDMVGKLQFAAADSATTTNFIVADIEAQATNTITTDINPGRLLFRTTSTAVAATPVEKFRLDLTEAVFNDTSLDYDFRVESDGDANMFFVDAGTNRIGMRTNAPATSLDIQEQTGATPLIVRLTSTDTGVDDAQVTGKIEFYSSDASTNGTGIGAYIAAVCDSASGINTALSFATSAPNSGNGTEVIRITSSGNVGISTGTATAAKLHVDQTSTTGALPVITVDQADVDEDFFKFIGTSDTSVDRALVDAANFPNPGTITGWLKINIQDDQATNPIPDGDYYIPFYTAPTA